MGNGQFCSYRGGEQCLKSCGLRCGKINSRELLCYLHSDTRRRPRYIASLVGGGRGAHRCNHRRGRFGGANCATGGGGIRWCDRGKCTQWSTETTAMLRYEDIRGVWM